MIPIGSEDLGESNHVKKVRVSSIVVFPATAINVFAIGFSLGIVNGEPIKGLSLFGANRGRKEDVVGVYSENLNNLGKFSDGFEVKVSELKEDVRRALGCNRVEVSDLEGYVDAVASIGLCVSNTRNTVEDCISSVLVEDQEVERHLHQKPSRKRKEIPQNGFDFFQVVWNFLGENAVDVKPNKKKDACRSEAAIKDINNPAQRNLFSLAVEERLSDSKDTDDDGKLNREDPCSSCSYQILDWNRNVGLGDRREELKKVLDCGKKDSTG
ncbi:hypothetical protein Ancab_033819 [Ancistrocladus abbreviatus]